MEHLRNRRLPVTSGHLKPWFTVIVHRSLALSTTSWEITTRHVIFYSRYFSNSIFHWLHCALVIRSNPGSSRLHVIAAWMLSASGSVGAMFIFLNWRPQMTKRNCHHW